MRKILLLSILFAFVSILSAQSPAKYWVQFKDKQGTTYSIDRPEEFLSPRAIAKRTRFHIEITEQDLPISEVYVKKLLAIDANMVVMSRSKWLNGVTVYTTTPDIIEKIKELDFVELCECTVSLKNEEDFSYPKSSYAPPATTQDLLTFTPNQDCDYGYSLAQTFLNRAQWLHRLGAHGEGMVVCVLDAGFKNADDIPHFEAMRKEGRLLGTKNLVFPGRSVFISGSHGTMALSCIGGYLESEMLGTAPKASFYLAKTEDERSENKIEEDNWVAGIEWADSLGCDVINSSLGYSKFDNKLQSYTYQDMNGHVSRASIAADIAASKGILVCVSAGNEGNDKWHYITAPADAENIITVGATAVTGAPANFSSHGPTSDNRVKPDAAAVGFNTVLANAEGETDIASGTSFSSPLLCGMVTCLWQLCPEKSVSEVINAVRAAGHISQNPNDKYGYGVTNFLAAYNYLKRNFDGNVRLAAQTVCTKSKCVAQYFTTPLANTFSLSVSMDGSDYAAEYVIEPKHKGEVENLKIKMPKLSKDQQYGIVRLTVRDNSTGIQYEQVVGLAKK